MHNAPQLTPFLAIGMKTILLPPLTLSTIGWRCRLE